MKFLIIQLRQLGDILLTTPVIQAIKTAHPDATVDFMTYPMGRLIIPGNPLVSKHWIAPQSGIVEMIRFLRDVRKNHYDVIIDFMGTPRSAMLARLGPAKRRISFDTGRAFLFTDVAPRDGEPDYIVREKFRLLAPLGIKATDERLRLPWSDTDAGVARMFMMTEPLLSASRRRVILSPTHRRPERRWPLERWAELALWLEKEQNAKVIWIWGPGEDVEIDQVMGMVRGVGVKAPKTTFRELAALIASTDLFICNCNGPSHISVAVNTPSIRLRGPTSLISWSPLTSRHQGVQRQGMADITVQDVKDKVTSMWSLIDIGAGILRGHGAISNAEEVWHVRPDL